MVVHWVLSIKYAAPQGCFGNIYCHEDTEIRLINNFDKGKV